MKTVIFVSLIISALFLNGCNTVDSANLSGKWLIKKDEIFDGGPGRDGIPSIDNPQFTNVNDAPYLQDDDLVIGIKIGDYLLSINRFRNSMEKRGNSFKFYFWGFRIAV